MTGLCIELLKFIGWGIVLVYLLKYRKGLPINIFYLMLISSFLMIHSEIYDILYKQYINKNYVWFFTDVVVMVVYIAWIKRYKKYQKLFKKDIDNFIENKHDEERVKTDN